MPPSLAEILESLSASGLLSQDDARTAIHAQPPPTDARSCLDVLVKRGTLTPFQAKVALEGRQHELVFGEYIVLDRIGAGGMGEVFKAVHKRMDRVVAVKRLPAQAMHTPGAVQRFYREVKAAAKLTHPNIVAAYDAGEAHGSHFLVMEYINGLDLSGLLKEQGRLPIDRTIEIIRQAATGLAYAHGKGVIHRDIKPGNILITGDGTAKLLDMGLARVHQTGSALGESVGEDEATSASAVPELTLTQEGRLMGTVEYMAPEQASDAHAADARADIYSLGCTLYRCLTGNLPFTGDTAVQKILAHTVGPIPLLTTERPEVPEQLEAVYLNMVAKKPEDRYQSMTDVIAALDAAQASSSVPKARDRNEAQDHGSTSQPAQASQSPAGSERVVPTVPAPPATMLIDPATIPVARSKTQRESQERQPQARPSRKPAGALRARRWSLMLVAVLFCAGVVVLLSLGGGSDDNADEKRLAAKSGPVPPGAPTDAATTLSKADAQPAPQWLDALALIDPAQDAVDSNWAHADGALRMSRVLRRKIRPMIRIPLTIAGDYHFQYRVTLPETGYRIVGVTLPVASRSVTLMLSPTTSSLEWYDDAGELMAGGGKPENEQIPVTPGEPHLVDVWVRQQQTNPSITAHLDGRPFIEWSGDVKLFVAPTWPVEDPACIAFGAYENNSYPIHQARLNMLSGSATLQRRHAGAMQLPLWITNR